ARSVTAGGAVTLRASGVSSSSSSATASASGAKDNSSSGGGGAAGDGVDQQLTKERTNADQVAAENDGASSGTTATPSASTSSGKVNVAAAVGVVVATV